MKDKNKAHDVVHTFFGGKAENCPSCKGTLDEKSLLQEAEKIACENYKPRVDPKLPWEQRLMQYADHDGNIPTVTQESLKLRDIDSDLRPMIDVISFAEGKDKIPTRIKVIPYGKYKMARYGEVTIDKKKVLEMIKHFEEDVRASTSTAGLPIDVEHGTTQYKDAAAGWLKKLTAGEDGGYADVEWTKLGEDLLRNKIYKFYSPEFWFNYIDPENTDIKLNNVMTGGGLVNKPMIKHDFKPIVNSEAENQYLTNNSKAPTIFLELTNSLQKQSTMQLSEILKIAKANRTSEQQKFVSDHKDELTFAEAKVEGFAQDAGSSTTVQTVTNGIVLSEGQKIVKAEEFDALVKLAERGANADRKLQRAELVEEIKKVTFSEKGVKLPADQVEKWADKLMKMSEEDKTSAIELLGSLPEKLIFGEIGNTNEVTGSAAGEDLDKKAKELVASEKITYGEALSRIAAANPVQLGEYNQNLPVATQER